MLRTLAMVVAASALLFGEITSFSDVRYEYEPSEKGKVAKADGMLHMDTTEKILSFSSDNRVLVNIPYAKIREVIYESGNDHLLTILYRTSGFREPLQFHLNGANRTEILRRLNTQLPEDVVRTGF